MRKPHLETADSVIFIVDAADRPRIARTTDEPREVSKPKEQANAKLLVCASNLGRSNCMTLQEIEQHMELARMAKNKFNIVGAEVALGKALVTVLTGSPM